MNYALPDNDEPPAGDAAFAGEYLLTDGIAEPPDSEDPAELPPIIPDWVRDRHSLTVVTTSTARRTLYQTVFHAARLHVYWWRLARQAHVGIWRAIVALWHYTWDTQGKQLLGAATSVHHEIKGDAQRLQDRHADAIKRHLVIDLAVLTAAVLAVRWVWLAVPEWAQPSALITGTATTLALLGWFGRDEGQPILERWISNGVEVPKLTENLILHALRHSQIPKMEAAVKEHGDKAIRWITPIKRIHNGYETVIDLPDGITVANAVARTDHIASGLQRPASTVWLTGLSEEQGGHASRLRIVVTDTPMRAAAVPSWPLADPETGTFDIFQPIPLGINYLGESVKLNLMFKSGIVGAVPRVGKTFTLRLVALAAALDPTVELHIYDLKGGIDFKPLGRHVAHAFFNTQDPKRAPDILKDLRYLDRDMRRRYDTLDHLEENEPERCPEGKITRDLANDKRLGLHPVLLVIDETQTAFVDWNDGEFEAIITRLAKQGPAVGVMVLLATQSVNSKTIPRSISVTAAVRFCLKVTDHVENDLVLGTSAYSRGYRASDLTMADLGIGYLGGEGQVTQLLRCHLVDGQGAEEIAKRARALRERTGWLSGMAAGEEPDNEDTDSVIEHAVRVWPVGQQHNGGRLHLADLADLLSAEIPDIYTGHGAKEIGALVRTHGDRLVRSQLKIGDANRPGIEWAALAEVAADRELARTQGTQP